MALKYNWEWEQKHSVKSSINQSNYINEMIAGMKKDGDWTKADRIAVVATETQAQAKVYLNSPNSTQVSEVNSPTFTAKQGYTGNGSSMYLNMNYNASTDGVQFTLNSGAIHSYRRSANVQEQNFHGSNDASSRAIYLRERGTSNTTVGRINAAAASVSGANTDGRGFFTAVRTASNANAVYKNGSSLGTDTTASVVVPNVNNFCIAANNNGAAFGYSAGQFSFFAFTSGTVSFSNMYTRVQNYMTRIGAQV